MTNGKDFAEKMFSMNEEERLYSTGSDELDAMLEKAFCEGYEYAQREFACKDKECKEEEKKKHTGAKVAAGVGGTAAAAGATVYGADKLGKVISKKGAEKISKAAEINERVDRRHVSTKGVGSNKKAIDAAYDKAAKLERKGVNMKTTGETLQKPMKYVRQIAKKIVKK